jgi:uncharacterized protein
MNSPSATQPAGFWWKNPAVPYVLPFVLYVGLMALGQVGSLPFFWAYAIRCTAALVALLAVSMRVVSLRVSSPWTSIALGVAVFLLWIGPDVLFGAAYRHHWLFENSLTGKAASSAPDALRGNVAFLVWRVIGCAIIVPPLEELFWRGWLMRWLAGKDFEKFALGTYAPYAFWVVALLFGVEHGPYWEVGLATGILFNWWMVRTKSLGDVTLAHAVTNALLSAYVLLYGQWQYWM